MRALVLSALALVAVTPLSGQGRPLQVRGQRPLAFGLVLPGVPRFVARTDPAASGEFEIRGAKFATVLLQFTLPVALSGPGGAAMPLSFGANDAGYSATGSVGQQTGFNPNVGGTGTLAKNGKGTVFLGGTARPTTGQPAGAYVGTVVLTVTIL
jgi:hypothetical protein